LARLHNEYTIIYMMSKLCVNVWGRWKTVTDFTMIQKSGVDIDKLLKHL